MLTLGAGMAASHGRRVEAEAAVARAEEAQSPAASWAVLRYGGLPGGLSYAPASILQCMCMSIGSITLLHLFFFFKKKKREDLLGQNALMPETATGVIAEA